MRLVDTIKNIWKIEDLRKWILITILYVVIYRLDSFIVLPGVNPDTLTSLASQTSEGLMALLNIFSGGAFSNASILALGIMPYISVSIIVQLAAIIIPSTQKMQHGGESGRHKINQWTHYLTVLILLIQTPAYLLNLDMQLHAAGVSLLSGFVYRAFATIILTAGSMFVLWLGRRIIDKGADDGILFIILIGIIARLPHALIVEFSYRLVSASGGLVTFLTEIVFLLFVTAGAILLVQSARKVPMQYAKRVVGDKQCGGARQYIPLKVDAANVMPIIFAQAVIFIPIPLASYFTGDDDTLLRFIQILSDNTSFWYNSIFATLITLFAYFYTAITINPTQMADNLKRNNESIPDAKPGRSTRDCLDGIMDRITLPGAFFLALVTIMPAFAQILGISSAFTRLFGGASLLILVGVALDTLQQIESHLLMHHYDGLLKSGRIKGRMGSVSAY